MNCCICSDDKSYYNKVQLNEEIISHKLLGSSILQYCESIYNVTTIENYNRKILKINKDFTQILTLINKLPNDIWYKINTYISNTNGKVKLNYILLKNLFIESYDNEIFKLYINKKLP